MQSKPRTEARELERARTSRDELAERIAGHLPEDGSLQSAPGLFLSRSSLPTPVYRVTEPSFCFIAQGSKEVLLGKERYRYDASSSRRSSGYRKPGGSSLPAMLTPRPPDTG